MPSSPRRPAAFTLIELVIVVTIIGIMLVSLIFMAGGQIRRMQFRTDYTLFANTINAVQSTMISSSALPPDGSLQDTDPNYGKVRKITNAKITLESGKKTITTEYTIEGSSSDKDIQTMRSTTIKKIAET